MANYVHNIQIWRRNIESADVGAASDVCCMSHAVIEIPISSNGNLKYDSHTLLLVNVYYQSDSDTHIGYQFYLCIQVIVLLIYHV